MLQAESVVVQTRAQKLLDHHQHQDIQENCQGIGLVGNPVSEIAQSAVPVGRQQHDEQSQAESEIGDPQPSSDAVIAPRFRRVRRHVGGVDHALVIIVPGEARSETQKCMVLELLLACHSEERSDEESAFVLLLKENCRSSQLRDDKFIR